MKKIKIISYTSERSFEQEVNAAILEGFTPKWETFSTIQVYSGWTHTLVLEKERP